MKLSGVYDHFNCTITKTKSNITDNRYRVNIPGFYLLLRAQGKSKDKIFISLTKSNMLQKNSLFIFLIRSRFLLEEGFKITHHSNTIVTSLATLRI